MSPPADVSSPPTPRTDTAADHDARWLAAGPLEALPPGGARVVRRDGRQIALFRLRDGSLHAVDNRCPHEGYPLAQGRLLGPRTLVCAWHNFTFDLPTGRCLAGDENLRVYPVRVRHGQMEIDPGDPDPRAGIPRHLESLEKGLLEGRMGQVARDVVRLLEAGVPAEELALCAARFDAERGEFGSNHATAVAADVLTLLPRFPGVQAVRPLMQVMDVASDPNVRRPKRPAADPVDPGPDAEAGGARFVDAALAMRFVQAEGLVRGALLRGRGRDVLEDWFLRLATASLMGFGHGPIYVTKAFDLLDRVGFERAGEVLPGLAVILSVLPHEEAVPSRGAFRRALAAAEGSLAGWQARRERRPFAGDERAVFLRSVLDGGQDRALGAVAGALDGGVEPAAIAHALVIAGAERMLRYDLIFERDPEVQEDWLDVCHTLTFASASRRVLERHRRPGALRLLFFGAWLVCRARALDRPQADEPSAPADPPAVQDVADAVVARAPERAVTLARAYLADGGALQPLRTALEDRVLADLGTRALFVAHQIKTLVAGCEEAEALAGDPKAAHPALAVVRMLASPMAERRLASATADALRFVAEGRTPRTLCP